METVFFQNDVVEMLNDFYVTDPIKPVVKRGCRVRIGHTGITSMAMTRKPFYRGVFVPIRIPDHRNHPEAYCKPDEIILVNRSWVNWIKRLFIRKATEEELKW